MNPACSFLLAVHQLAALEQFEASASSQQTVTASKPAPSSGASSNRQPNSAAAPSNSRSKPAPAASSAVPMRNGGYLQALTSGKAASDVGNPNAPAGASGSGAAGGGKGECFNCKQTGHWSRDWCACCSICDAIITLVLCSQSEQARRWWIQQQRRWRQFVCAKQRRRRARRWWCSCFGLVKRQGRVLQLQTDRALVARLVSKSAFRGWRHNCALVSAVQTSVQEEAFMGTAVVTAIAAAAAAVAVASLRHRSSRLPLQRARPIQAAALL